MALQALAADRSVVRSPTMDEPKIKPLVYSCSGASSAAQMTNHLAVRLDRLEIAEMSCIAGVGGDVEPLVRTAQSGRPVLAIDGCPLHCAAHILKRHGISPTRHYDLSQFGVRKRRHSDFDRLEAAQVLHRILRDLKHSAPGHGEVSDSRSGEASMEPCGPVGDQVRTKVPENSAAG